MASIQQFVDSTINKHPVVVFSKRQCPFCKRTKETLQRMLEEKFPYYTVIIELDERDDGTSIQEYLRERTGQRTVPNTFIGGTHIGGNDNLQARAEGGELKGLLQEAIAKHAAK